MKTLDDVERTFDSDAVLVCDTNGPSGIAGIMGGQVSEVSETTTRVLLEVATWVGTNILETSGKLGLRSEASTRFEKQLHPDLCMRAQAVASQLLVELCGAKLVPGTIDEDAKDPAYDPFSLELRASRTDGLLGMDIGRELAATYLGRLGFGTAAQGDDVLSVAVPPDRHFDTTREVDLIEEVGRVHGIDEHLPATLPPRPPGAGGLARHQLLLRRAEDTLAGAGLDEAITWSFVGPGAADALGLEGVRGVVVHNPLSEDQSVMRTELLGGLLDAASYNLARGAARAGLFESGRVYLPEPAPSEGGVLDGRFAGNRAAPAQEPHRIAAVVSGSLADPGWRGQEAPADFYLAKGLLEHLCASLRAEVTFEPGTRPFLHPGRAADVTIGGLPAGWVGELHPTMAAARDLPATVAFEIAAGVLIGAAGRGEETYRDLTSYPAVLEDISVSIPASVSANAVLAAIREGGGPLLREARLFDVYEGDQLGGGNRSLSFRLAFRADDRTLTDDDIDGPKGAILAELAKLGGSLRG
jgi:phenylalanyl-tRNA synthetase beta chain